MDTDDAILVSGVEMIDLTSDVEDNAPPATTSGAPPGGCTSSSHADATLDHSQVRRREHGKELFASVIVWAWKAGIYGNCQNAL